VLRARGSVGKLDQWDSLIGELYESVLNPSSLNFTLSKIDSWIGSSFCHFLVWDNRENRERFSILTDNAFSDAINKYKEYYGYIDPRRQMMAAQPIGTVWACHDYFDERFVDRSEIYQDLLLPIGVRHVLLGYILEENGLSAYLVFNHMKGQGYFSDDQRAAASRLVPHVQRAIRLAVRNENFRGGLFAGAAGLDALEQAVFTLDASERVIFMNSAGRALLDAGCWIKTRGSSLVASSHNEAEKFRAALARARLSSLPESFALYGVENAGGDPADTQLVTILPIPRDGVQSHAGDAGLAHGSQVAGEGKHGATFLSLGGVELVVLIAPQRRKSAMSAAALKVLFKLTPAEARLSHELAKGVSVEGYADAAAIQYRDSQNPITVGVEQDG
jgi:hypothetical protein